MTEEQAVEGIEWATNEITALRAKVDSLEAAQSPRIPAAPDDVERVLAALQAQEEDETVQQLPSSMCRERGLVWLSGWFDLSAAISAIPIPATGELEKALRKAAARLRLASDGPEDKATIRKWSDEALAATKDDE